MNDFKNKCCIVTGGAGFIGQNIVKKLVDKGAEVFVVDNFSFGSRRSNVDKRAQVIRGDIRAGTTFKKLPSRKFDYFFHFAAPSSIVLFQESLSECVEITTVGFVNAIKFAAENNIDFIYPSTGSIYSGASSVNIEGAEINPELINSYAKNKLTLEQIAAIYEGKIRTLGLRIFAGYGPSEKHKGDFASVVYSFARKMVKGERPIIWGDGSQQRDFLYIDDLGDIVLELTQCCEERIVNIGSGKATSFNRLVSEINKILSKNIKPVYVPKPKVYLEKTLSENSLRNKYFNKELVPIEEGIRRIIESLKIS
jgi:nucleoside-diphosphate-sugar epimerase